MDHASDARGRLEDCAEQLREDGLARRDVGDGLELLAVEHGIAKKADFHLGLLEFLFKVLDGLGGGEDFAFAHDEGRLADEVVADVGQARFGERLAHVAVLGDRATGTARVEAIAKLGELLNGEAGVIDDDQVRRGVDAIQQAVDDDFLVGEAILQSLHLVDDIFDRIFYAHAFPERQHVHGKVIDVISKFGVV